MLSYDTTHARASVYQAMQNLCWSADRNQESVREKTDVVPATAVRNWTHKVVTFGI
jgi:hypothetical protein